MAATIRQLHVDLVYCVAIFLKTASIIDLSTRLKGLQNPAKEVMGAKFSHADAETANPELAVQEFYRPLRRSQTADFTPGPSQGKPQNPDDPLRQALIAIIEPQRAKEFFLKQLKAAEQSNYHQLYGKLFRLKERGLVDVTKGIEVYDKQRFTALHILYPGSALLSM